MTVQIRLLWGETTNRAACHCGSLCSEDHMYRDRVHTVVGILIYVYVCTCLVIPSGMTSEPHLVSIRNACPMAASMG